LLVKLQIFQVDQIDRDAVQFVNNSGCIAGLEIDTGKRGVELNAQRRYT